MKRIVTICLVCLLTFSACAVPIDLTGEGKALRVQEISERPEEYFGKLMEYTGYYAYEEMFGVRYHYVMCEPTAGEQNVGFEIRWDGDYPEAGTFIRVRGTLEYAVEYETTYIYLALTALEEEAESE